MPPRRKSRPKPRANTGEAISESRRTGADLEALETLLAESEAKGDLATWKRARAVLRYIQGKKTLDLVEELAVSRSAINTWLRWYETQGAEGLRPRKAPGPAPKLTSAQREQLASWIEGGPQSCGFTSGMWTGPMIGKLIEERFGVRYHNHHVPRLLHAMGFSVQRPRKRLARADQEQQAIWLRERLPAIKKKPQPVEA
jgi:transposase